MYLLYLDDSGSGEPGNGEHFVIGGVCLDVRTVPLVTNALNAIAAQLKPADPYAIEFHASAVWNGKEGWSELGLKRDQRQQVMRDVLAVAGRAGDGLKLFATVRHKATPGVGIKLDHVDAAFVGVAKRFEEFLRRVDGYGLIILDESTRTITGRLRTIDRTLRETTAGLRFERIVDGPLFVSSKEFRCTQLADHVAYAVFRRYEAGDATYFDQIAHRFDMDGRVVHGLMHHTENTQQCLCPACLSRR